MAKYEPFSILPLEYFAFGNSFSGSRGLFNYKIIPSKETIHLITWYGKNCSAKSELAAEEDFPLAEESRKLICTWLEEQFLIYDKKRLAEYLAEEH